MKSISRISIEKETGGPWCQYQKPPFRPAFTHKATCHNSGFF